MPSNIFIALQCFQCSTMQVKQQKKSSNKWRCVVCNEKQSVRKVFAQSHMARDVRVWVQSFNMSRKFADEKESPPPAPAASHPEDHGALAPANQTKRRTDWTEYLDSQDHHGGVVISQQEQDGGDFEAKIVTELHKEMYKRPKLNDYTSRSDSEEIYKPVFPKRNASVNFISKDAEQPKCTSSYKEPRIYKPTMGKKASKWNDYIAQDEDGLQVASREILGGKWGNADFETNTKDERIEDDIHPDFM